MLCVLCVLIGLSYIFFCEMYVQISWLFKNWLVFLWLCFTSSLYILDKSPCSGARCDGPNMQTQHFGRLRQVDHLRSVQDRTWPTWWNPISTKNTEISQAWWQMPVIPATWEAEAQELLEPGRWRLQWAEIMPLHSSLGNKSETLTRKKKKIYFVILFCWKVFFKSKY